MPFPPPAPAPGAPGARPPPRRPGAPRKAAVPACAPPAPPAREKQRPPEGPEAPPTRSWPSATLRRPPARRGSGLSALGPSAGSPPSRTPEAARPVPRRHLEQQLPARPRRALPAPSADARRPLAPGPRATAAGPRRGGDPGAQDARPPKGPGPRRALPASLLRDRHRYEDVELEPAAPDERLVRRCTEWLRGVESATAARPRPGALDAPP